MGVVPGLVGGLERAREMIARRADRRAQFLCPAGSIPSLTRRCEIGARNDLPIVFDLKIERPGLTVR